MVRRVRKVRRDLGKDFHGVSDKPKKASLRVPKRGDVLVRLGYLEALVYKPEGKSLRKGTYEHKFGDTGSGKRKRSRPVLAVSRDGRQLYVINGRSKYKVTGKGIVG